jgi:CBS domain-containing protein
LSLKAKDIMTRDVVTVSPEARIEEAIHLMAEKHVSGLPVVDGEGRVVGIITENDVLLKDEIPIQAPRIALFGWYVVPDELSARAYREARGVLVQDAMTRKVVSFDEEAEVADIARAMVDRKINRVPIMRDGRLVGVVSRADIVRAMAE